MLQAETCDQRAESPITPPADKPAMQRAQEVLEQIFGYKAFRLDQEQIIETVVNGGDALALMPTGGGKSLCYQIPALVREGTGIVVSPLIALMQDQVSALRQAGVKAAFLNSSLSWKEQQAVEWELTTGELDLLYIAPERLVQERTMLLLGKSQISLFAIDEAHCVSQWGHDFRPEYRQLKILAEAFPDTPRIALTATADERTREEIVTELCLENAQRFVSSFDRPNIRYTIAEGGSMSGRERLWRFIETDHASNAGIIYCLSRRSVEETASWLQGKGRNALAYHAGLDPERRRDVQERFLREDGIIVVATIAFGMGIDKPDVRFVAHLSLPKSIEAYYQETGRAGRDGEPADAWMIFGLQDVVMQRQWIAQSDADERQKKVQRDKLDKLIGLCEMVTCRRQALLSYFSESGAPPCGNCDNCLTPPETTDGTEQARKALSAVFRTGQGFGVTYVIDVLLGKEDERICRNDHDQISTYGIGKDFSAAEWKGLFRQLVSAGFLTPDDEGHGTLQLTERARPLLRGEETFQMRRVVALPRSRKARSNKSSGKSSGAAPIPLNALDAALYDALKALRTKLATKAKVPPYVICHDKTLIELAQKHPKTLDDLPDITGLGAAKIKRYGKALLKVVGGFKPDPLLDNNLSPTVNQTLALHLQTQDAQAIAATRGLELSTVYGHFAEAIEAGLLETGQVLSLDDDDTAAIMSAFEQCETLDSGKLGPAHTALDGRYDYGVLKCLLAELS